MLNFGSKCSSEVTKNLRRFTRARWKVYIVLLRVFCIAFPLFWDGICSYHSKALSSYNLIWFCIASDSRVFYGWYQELCCWHNNITIFLCEFRPEIWASYTLPVEIHFEVLWKMTQRELYHQVCMLTRRCCEWVNKSRLALWVITVMHMAFISEIKRISSYQEESRQVAYWLLFAPSWLFYEAKATAIIIWGEMWFLVEIHTISVEHSWYTNRLLTPLYLVV